MFFIVNKSSFLDYLHLYFHLKNDSKNFIFPIVFQKLIQKTEFHFECYEMKSGIYKMRNLNLIKLYLQYK